MPRPLVFGNRRLLVQLDHRGNIRDLSWPIGIWNHLSGRAIRIGVWADGMFAWLDGFGWTRELRYVGADPLVGWESHEHPEVGVRLQIESYVPPDEDRFVRNLRVANLRAHTRDVKVFFGHDLRLLESDIGECALWHPDLGGIVHFKGECAALFRLSLPSEYACNEPSFGSHSGPWEDAQDGHLSMKPIAQGTVDSCLSVGLQIDGHGSSEFTYEICFAGSMDELPAPGSASQSPAPQFPPKHEVQSSELHLAIIGTQISKSGAILAANDSDIIGNNKAHYSYCWPRDGANIAEELLHWPGGKEDAERFLRFGIRLLEHRPYFLQKYRADGTLGPTWHPWTQPLPIQVDETAAFVSFVVACTRAGIALSEGELELGVKGPIRFLLDYREGDLPGPGYDLWEERRGVFAYTTAMVIRAFRDAAELFPSKVLTDADDRMTATLGEQLWNAAGFFKKSTDCYDPDSSTLCIGVIGALPIDDERVQQNAKTVEERLWIHNGIGGLARYAGDYYHRVNERHPGNPWLITTLWLAQHEVLSGRVSRAEDLLQWALDRAHSTGVLPEQCHPETGEPLSVSPLTWSHGELLRTMRLIRTAKGEMR